MISKTIYVLYIFLNMLIFFFFKNIEFDRNVGPRAVGPDIGSKNLGSEH